MKRSVALGAFVTIAVGVALLLLGLEDTARELKRTIPVSDSILSKKAPVRAAQTGSTLVNVQTHSVPAMHEPRLSYSRDRRENESDFDYEHRLIVIDAYEKFLERAKLSPEQKRIFSLLYYDAQQNYQAERLARLELIEQGWSVDAVEAQPWQMSRDELLWKPAKEILTASQLSALKRSELSTVLMIAASLQVFDLE